MSASSVHRPRSLVLPVVLSTSLAAVCGCDEKKATPAPAITAAPPSSSLPAHAPSSPAPSAASSRAAKKIGLRELIWTEKTPAETAYVDCMVKHCAGVYEKCFGASVVRGEFSGPCAPYGACVARCTEEGDDRKASACTARCLDEHKAEGSACDTCTDEVGGCSAKGKCAPPIDLPR